MTYIYEKVDFNAFERAFRAFGRCDQLGGYDGLCALFAYYEDVARSTGEPIELDIVAICCDWTLYDSAVRAAIEYGAEQDRVQTEQEALGWLRNDRDFQVLTLPDGRVLVSE